MKRAALLCLLSAVTSACVESAPPPMAPEPPPPAPAIAEPPPPAPAPRAAEAGAHAGGEEEGRGRQGAPGGSRQVGGGAQEGDSALDAGAARRGQGARREDLPERQGGAPGGAREQAPRSPAHAERDKYRHPVETLEFFGFKPTMTVLEYGPGEGWYTELLAPALAKKGKLLVTNDRSERPGRRAQHVLRRSASSCSSRRRPSSTARSRRSSIDSQGAEARARGHASTW